MRFVHLSFLFLFLIIASVSFLSPITLADQIVLDKYGSPLILNEQEIILKNDLSGNISWEDFKKDYRLRGINGVWHIVELEKEAIPDYQPKPIDYDELKESFAQPRKEKEAIPDYQPKPIDYDELKESFAQPRKEKEAITDYQPKPIDYDELKESFAQPRKEEKAIPDYQPKPIDYDELRESFAQPDEKEDQISDVDLTMMSEEQMNIYIKQLFSPIILCLIGAILVVVGIAYYTNIYVASLGVLIYMIICVIMGFLPIWILVLVVLASAGIIAYSLSSKIGGGE